MNKIILSLNEKINDELFYVLRKETTDKEHLCSTLDPLINQARKLATETANGMKSILNRNISIDEFKSIKRHYSIELTYRGSGKSYHCDITALHWVILDAIAEIDKQYEVL